MINKMEENSFPLVIVRCPPHTIGYRAEFTRIDAQGQGNGGALEPIGARAAVLEEL